MGREQSLRLDIVVSSGSGTGTLSNSWDIVRWLRIKPIAESDTFDLTIKDGEGIIMLYRQNYQGTYSENINMSLGIMKTIEIVNAVQDGTYSVRLDMN